VRGPLAWIVAAAGVVVVILVVAAIGGRDKSDETVTAGEWAQSMCGAVGVWRGQMEAIVEDIRTPSSAAPSGEEPQSETPQGRTGLVRSGLERAIEATETMVEGLDNAGIPDTAAGEDAAEDISNWANGSLNDLEEAEESLDEEAETLEEAVEQIGGALGTLGSVVANGVQAITTATLTDPELASALQESSTCQELREEAGEE
jgi:hypothetical protein